MMFRKDKILLTLIFASVLIAFGCTGNYNKPRRISTEQFFKNPEKTNFQISPDGNYISFLKPVNNKFKIFINKIDSKEEICLTENIGQNIKTYYWVSNDKIVYTFDVNGNENFQIFSVDIKTKTNKALINLAGVNSFIVNPLYSNADEILIASNKSNKANYDVYLLNINTGALKLQLKNNGKTTGWLTDNNGVIRIISTTDGVNTGIYYRKNKDEEFKLSAYSDYKDDFIPRLFTPDNKYIYALSNYNRDKIELVKYDLENNKELEVVYKNEIADIKDVIFTTYGQKLIGVSFIRHKQEKIFLDEKYKTLDKQLTKYFGGLIYEMISFSKDESKVIIRTYSDKTLGSYYIYDTKQKEPKKLADLSPWVNEDEMSDMSPISYKARDNRTIYGYLSLPKGIEPKSLPVVVVVHGGPWLRDVWGYNSAVQFLTNRGYAVLQVNYRGSRGYGKEFMEAGFKQWGQKMQDDIADGTRWLIRQGIADSAKIAIYGFSFGGYSALMGIIKYPELYKCGVSYSGLINLVSFLNSIPSGWAPFKDMLYEMVGNPVKDSSMLINSSPFHNVDKIDKPVFIAQGMNDPKVNTVETNELVRKLKDKGAKVNYLVKENEGHGFENETNRIEFFKTLEEFLSNNIGH